MRTHLVPLMVGPGTTYMLPENGCVTAVPLSVHGPFDDVAVWSMTVAIPTVSVAVTV